MDRGLRHKRKRVAFSIVHSMAAVEKLMDGELPDDTVFKLISDGNFSSISLIMYIAQRATINKLCASTYRIGAKELTLLNGLCEQGKLQDVSLITGKIITDDTNRSRGVRLFEFVKKVFEKNAWELRAIDNHSKLILMDTDKGKFVIETSSNLNENPNIEFFSVEKSDELYDFYRNWFEERLVGEHGEG